ncbi:MAG: hypothetical protein M1824_001119 [Vezdaea acicularis]|nr:MAG: hypothetical protein M1824_001119 [Vezdaea acicularis]
MLIGSNAIQLIALKNDFVAFSRKADAKIGLLREVIERVQNGEEVDVAGLLGTGDKEQEKEWEEVLKELEEEDENWLSKSQRRREKAEKAINGSDEKENVNNFTTQDTMDDAGDVSKPSNTKLRPPKAVSGFY